MWERHPTAHHEFIVRYLKAEGRPPTNREIGRAVGMSSTAHVTHHLAMLEKLGWIRREPRKSRGIKLTAPLGGTPVIGTIAAGVPLDIFPGEASPVMLQPQFTEAEGAYALQVKGQSMIEDAICDGDYVVVTPQSTYRNGDIVVALHRQGGVHGSATLKRFFEEAEHVRLQPANATMEPLLIPKPVWTQEWQIQGKVIAIFRQVQVGSMLHCQHGEHNTPSKIPQKQAEGCHFTDCCSYACDQTTP